MYNVLLYGSYEAYDAYDGDFTRVTFDTLDEAFDWARKALEQGCIATIVPLKDED